MSDLRTLAGARFDDFTTAELRLLRSVCTPNFAVCGYNMQLNGKDNDPILGSDWPKWRRIRAELIRWLCMDPQARALIDPEGIEVFGARVEGDVDLSNLTIPFPLAFIHCHVMSLLDLTDTHILELNLDGTYVRVLAANGLTTTGSVFLRNGFTTEDTIRVMGAQVGGNFECDGGTFKKGLYADGVKVSGSLFLRHGFNSHEEVRLFGASVDGNVECDNGAFENHAQASAGPKIRALNMDNAVVKGDVYLRNGFSAEGDASLIGAQISGDLDCTQARIVEELNIARCVVRGAFFWRQIPNRDSVKLELSNAAVYFLEDESPSWPNKGNLRLDGFSYSNLSDGTRNVDGRLDWLSRQQRFNPQPYRQLAKVYAYLGDEDAAQRVLVQMQNLQRSEHWYQRPESWFLRWSIGYGYHPLYAFWELVGLAGLGWIIYRRAELANTMVPTDNDAYALAKSSAALPPSYPRFSPLVYSIENSLPLIDLGQGAHWQPDPDPQTIPPSGSGRWSKFDYILKSPKFLRRFLWVQIILGWILATLFAAGVTGIIRKD
jgi:hypothetical protein